jgi:hypothetical protein
MALLSEFLSEFLAARSGRASRAAPDPQPAAAARLPKTCKSLKKLYEGPANTNVTDITVGRRDWAAIRIGRPGPARELNACAIGGI